MIEPIDKKKVGGNTTDAARDHQSNEHLRDQAQTTDKAALNTAFANYQKTKIPDGTTGTPKAPETKSPTSHADHPEAGLKPNVANAKPDGNAPSHKVATQVGNPEQGRVVPKAGDTGPKIATAESNSKNISPNSANTNSVKIATSTFELNPKGQAPALSDLLFKPKHEVQQSKKSEGPPPHIDSHESVVPTASPEGAKMAFTPSKEGAKNNDNEATPGDKKPKRSEKGASAGAKGSAQATGETQGDQALEASSGGVAGGSDGPTWIADQPSGVEGYNADSPGDKAFMDVLTGYRLFSQFIVKGAPYNKGALILATADPVSGDATHAELERSVRINSVFPPGPYGLRRG